ncbi:MAG: methyltransferase domain-containing protein [Anaerolinea sp.]|nr:methyltransferase domain-containing protein [Anaerolinea sp.]
MSFDSQQYKSTQHQHWELAATGWNKWQSFMESASQQMSDRMADLAELEPGQHILDIASGSGEPAITAAKRVGPQGRVVATDLSAAMLELGQKRAQSLGLANIDFQVVDGEALDFADNGFDAVLCRLGLMFFPNPDATLEQVHRMLTPGGRFVATVWGSPQQVPMADVIISVMQTMLELPPSAPGTPGVFSLGASELLEGKYTRAGYFDVQSEPLVVAFEWSSAESFVEMFRDTAPASTFAISRQPAEQQEEIWNAITEAVQQYATADGSIYMENTAICASGRKSTH